MTDAAAGVPTKASISISRAHCSFTTSTSYQRKGPAMIVAAIRPRCNCFSKVFFSSFLFAAIAFPVMTSRAQEDYSIGGNAGWVASFEIPLSDDEGDLRAIFDFGATRGFLGPSTNPSSQSGFSNTDLTLFAVNNAPMTKTSYVHLFLRSRVGVFLFLNDVNNRVASLLMGRFANSAKYFLRVESINGRIIHLQTVDFSAHYIGGPDQAPRYDFAVSVEMDGSLSLVRDTTAVHSENECSGVLRRDQLGLRLGGGIGEGEGICVISNSERAQSAGCLRDRPFLQNQGPS
jgi:hypothetical protein